MRQSRTLGSVGGGAQQCPRLPGPWDDVPRTPGFPISSSPLFPPSAHPRPRSNSSFASSRLVLSQTYSKIGIVSSVRNTKSKSHCSTPKAKYCSDSRQQLAERQARRPANANQAFQQQSRIRILKWPVEACDVLSDSTAEEQEREAAPIRERARKDCYAICTATKCGEKIMTRKTGCGSKPCYSRPHLLLIGAPIRRRSAL